MRWTLKTGGAVVAAIASVATASGVAYAYWSTNGTGQGSATTGTDTGVVVVQTSTNSSADLYPGASIPLSGNFNNLGPSKQYVGSVTAVVHTFTAQSDASKPACTDADFSILGTSTTPGELAVGSGVGTWSGLSLKLNDAATNQDNCKSLSISTLKIDYTAHAS